MAELIEGNINKRYYDAHAKNVIVDCKDGRDLESLIENGEIGGGEMKFDPSEAINILYLSTMPGMDEIEDTVYTYKYLCPLTMSISGNPITFYMYTRNASKNDNIPVGTIVMAEYYNTATIATLGGTWECLGKMELEIDEINQYYYLYKKTSKDVVEDTPRQE